MTGAIRVVVVEDQALLRQGLVRLLGDAGFAIVGEAGDAVAGLDRVRETLPDVAILDVQMPPDRTDDGLRAARAIRDELPGVGVLVLSQHLEERYALDLIGDDAHGVGYLLKDRVADVDAMAEAIRRVAAGGSALDPAVVARIVDRERRDDPLAGLTAREREVLALMAEGLSNHGIAARLGTTTATVEKHAGNTFGKLGLGREQAEHRRVMAVLTHLRADR